MATKEKKKAEIVCLMGKCAMGGFVFGPLIALAFASDNWTDLICSVGCMVLVVGCLLQAGKNAVLICAEDYTIEDEEPEIDNWQQEAD